MKREAYKSLRDLPREEFLAPGGPLCAGCGGLLCLRLFHNALGGDVVFVNAAGCFTLLAIYPFTQIRSSWIYTAMGCAPAGAQGVRDALDILVETGRTPRQPDRAVVVVTGDGAAQDIGLQSTIAAIHRGLDFYYFCYDNEAYGNTGFQMSPSSPYGSRTATSPPTALFPPGTSQERRDLFEIWRVQRPPYIATVSAAHPLDLSEKVYRASKLRGPRLFLALSPCPPGWGFETERSVEIARLAVNTGVWPLKEAVYGRVSHTQVPRRRPPVEEYLASQERFLHLFEPRRNEEAIAHIQAGVDRYWEEVAREEVISSTRQADAALGTGRQGGASPGSGRRRRTA